MTYAGAGTLIIGIVVNQIIGHGIRLSILFNSIPLISAKKIDYLPVVECISNPGLLNTREKDD